MKRALALTTVLVLLAGGSFWLDGFMPVGRLALKLGYPSVSVPFLNDPVWRGVALYRQEHYEDAVKVLRSAGNDGYFYRANALVKQGRLREAVEVYEAHLFALPNDADARFNMEIVASIADIEGDGQAVPGRIPETHTSGGHTSKAEKIARALAKWREGGIPSFDGQFVVASRQWLATLPDQPGRYLKLRIAAENERRLRLGTAVSSARDPW